MWTGSRAVERPLRGKLLSVVKEKGANRFEESMIVTIVNPETNPDSPETKGFKRIAALQILSYRKDVHLLNRECSGISGMIGVVGKVASIKFIKPALLYFDFWPRSFPEDES